MKAPLAAMIAIAGLGCASSPTEVVVTIDTTLGIPCTIDQLVVEATTSAGKTSTETVAIDPDDLPGSLTVVDDSAGQLTISVRGMLGDREVVWARQLVEPEPEASTEVHFLLDSSCSPGPCPAARQGRFESLPARASRSECGEESYVMADSLIPPRNACITDTLGRVLVGGVDEEEAELPLENGMPFPFFFYGQPVQTVWVGDNGYLALSPERPDAITEAIGDPRSLGEPGSYPEAAVLPFWDKMTTGSSGVCYAVLGNAPNRILWITWERVCFQGFGGCGTAPEGGSLTFSVGLEESSGKIIVGYHAMSAAAPNDDRARGQSATVGITSGREPRCGADECGDDGLCEDGQACGYTQASSATIRDPLQTIEFTPSFPD